MENSQIYYFFHGRAQLLAESGVGITQIIGDKLPDPIEFQLRE